MIGLVRLSAYSQRATTLSQAIISQEFAMKGCYLNARTPHLYQTLDLPKLISTTPWIYHEGKKQ